MRLFGGVAVGLIEKGDIGIPGMNPAGMRDVRRDMITVALRETAALTVDDKINPPRQDKAGLRGMGMLRQFDILTELHEKDLMGGGLRQKCGDTLERDVGQWKSGDRIGENTGHGGTFI